MGVREDGCNLKTTASIFETDVRCQSYNPNMYGAWGSGKICDRNLSKFAKYYCPPARRSKHIKQYELINI